MSSTNKTTNFELSQFAGTDIPSILNDYNGDMRKIDTALGEIGANVAVNTADISEVNARIDSQAQTITSLNGIVSSVSARVTTAENNITNISDDVNGIESLIPSKASTTNLLATMDDITSSEKIEKIENNVLEITEKIPENASEDNKLVTVSDLSDENVNVDVIDAIRTTQSHRTRRIYPTSSSTGDTLNTRLTEFFTAYKEMIGDTTRFYRGLPQIILKWGTIIFKVNDAPDSGSTFELIGFTSNGLGGIKSYLMNVNIGSYANINVSATIMETSISPSGITTKRVDDEDYDDIQGYVLSSEYSPWFRD